MGCPGPEEHFLLSVSVPRSPFLLALDIVLDTDHFLMRILFFIFISIYSLYRGNPL
jgi:hypothetical protein